MVLEPAGERETEIRGEGARRLERLPWVWRWDWTGRDVPLIPEIMFPCRAVQNLCQSGQTSHSGGVAYARVWELSIEGNNLALGISFTPEPIP